jgi:SAM-dependent methyltransferase
MDDADSSALWNRKYEEGLPSLTKPDPFFLLAYESFVHRSFPNAGRALDLAGGLGRHALWLANRNWRVTVVDVSSVAIGRLRQAADQQNVRLNLVATDTAQYECGSDQFDLIVLFYHLDRRLFAKIVSALTPGGLVVCKMAVRWDSRMEGRSSERPLARCELPSLVSDLQVVDHHERRVGKRGVVEFVGRKPARF